MNLWSSSSRIWLEAAGRALVGKLETTPNIKENVKSVVAIHSVTCDTAVYVPDHVRGHPVDWLVDTGSAVTLLNCCVSEKDFKLGMVSELVVSANS